MDRKQQMGRTLDAAIGTYAFCQNHKPKDPAVKEELDMLAILSLKTLSSLYSSLHMHPRAPHGDQTATNAHAARWVAKEKGLFKARAYATDRLLHSGVSMDDLIEQAAKYVA